MTRRQIDNAEPEEVLAMLRGFKLTAVALVSAADIYQERVRKPGGETWSGATADAVIRMADFDAEVIHDLRQAIDAMADTATHSINDPVIPNLNDLRFKIASAEAAGFTVNDDLTVGYPPTTPPDPRKKEDAERSATEIQAAATRWWDSDQQVADQINADNQRLAAKLNDGAIPFGLLLPPAWGSGHAATWA